MKTNLYIAIGIFPILLFSCQTTGNKKDKNPISENIDYGCESTMEDLLKIDEMVGVLYQLSPFDESAFDSIEMMNENIASELEALLSCAANKEYKITEPFPHLNYEATDDDRLRVFSWYANNGGTWQIYHSVYQCFLDEKTANAKSIYNYGGASQFYQLEENKPIYLGFGYTKTCSTCVGETAELFTITKDSLKIEEVIGFGARMGSVIHFDFDEKTKSIHFTVAKDDLNEDIFEEYDSYPISSLNLDEEDLEMMMGEGGVTIVDSLVWDGERFVGN